MSYASSDDLVARFGLEQLLVVADRDNDGALDADVIAGAIADASSIVDLALRGRYALPLVPVDAEILGIVCDLARTALYGQSTEVPQSVTDRDAAARKLLASIASGDYQLTAVRAADDDPAAEASEAELLTDDPVFTRDSLKGF